MNCVVQSVAELFPNGNYDKFPERKSGYSLCDIQRMIPEKYSVYVLLSNYRHIIKNDFDNITISLVVYSDIVIPLFMFTKTHCFIVYYNPEQNTIYKSENKQQYAIQSFFEQHLIYQIACVTSYDDYSILIQDKKNHLNNLSR
jgi:hypothetical protein